MRAFNPEKELKKIQRGNKNKVIIGIIALLLIISIGSTYALYQIRYSKRIIYTKVAPFNNKDLILSVYIDGKKVDKIPDKNEGYYFDTIECEEEQNLLNASWDYDEWYLSLPSIKIPNKCNINFSKKQSLLDKMRATSRQNNSNLIYDETIDHNLRYIGSAPNNYIWFNCNDYNFINPEEGDSYSTQATAKECEKWRIIGVLNNVTIIDGKEDTDTPTKKSLVKIMRNEEIGNIPFDNKNISTGAETDNGSNDWNKAELMYLLNPDNESHKLNGELANNSLYWNAESGLCSKEQNNVVGPCDFTDTGLKNQETREAIQKVRWYLGGVASINYGYHGVITGNDFYIWERGLNGELTTCGTLGNCQERNPYWDGNIALIYGSDYINATSGTENVNGRLDCLQTLAYNWSTGQSHAVCGTNTWINELPIRSDSVFLLTTLTHLLASKQGNIVITNGFTYGGGAVSAANHDTIPSLYLKPNIKTIGGTGTNDDPFVIIP